MEGKLIYSLISLLKVTEAASREASRECSWDTKANRPLVDGKIENSLTGCRPAPSAVFQGLGSPRRWRLGEKNSSAGFKIFQGASPPGVGRLLASVATLSRVSDMGLATVTASCYHVFVLCKTSEVNVDSAVTASL